MGSEKKPFKRKKKYSREDSLDLGTFSTSTEIKRSLIRKSRQSTADSDESWLKPYLQYDTPSPIPNPKDNSPSRESDLSSLISPEKLRLYPKREPSVVNVKSKGTGPHDNRLAKSQGDYREPSLRRGFGKEYAYAVEQPKAPRGDVNPAGHRPMIAIKKPAPVQYHSPPGYRTTQKGSEIVRSEGLCARQPSDSRDSRLWPIESQQKLVLTACLDLKAIFMDVAVKEQVFWESVAFQIFSEPSTSLLSCMRQWTVLKSIVFDWCQAYKCQRIEARMEVNALFDQWNKVYDSVLLERFGRRVVVTDKGMVEEPDNVPEAIMSKGEPVIATMELEDRGGPNCESATVAPQRERENSTARSEGEFCPKSELAAAAPRAELENPTEEHENRIASASESAVALPQSEPKFSTTEFEDRIWPAVEKAFLPFAERKILEWVEKKLQERMKELGSLTRPPLLKADSSPESYLTYVSYLKGRIHATGKKSTSIRETEAVMSMAVDLLPDVKEHLRKDLRGEHMGVDDNENDAESSGAIHEEGHDERSEEAYGKYSEDDVSCYQPSIIDSIEPRTPLVTPRITAQLRFYESKYVEAVRAAKAQKEAEDEAIRLLGENQPKKRKAPDDDLHGLAIRSRSNECKPVRHRVPETSVAPARKKQCLEELQPNRSPASSSISPGFPPIEQMFSSSLARESSAITQPTPTPAGRGLRGMNDSPIFGPFDDDATPALKPLVRADPSPGLFVTPDRPPSGQSDRLFRIKKSASRSPVLNERGAYSEKAEAPRFREETAEYQAMSPKSRDMMMYRAIRDMREKRY
ncbi:hypothetical protein FHETE_3277 [Fusarium heterosporum]|uniref:Uncharacterized protein n=1 Tax=Fusarium heterosporum TaxID=42747 RepID=A0A8H5TQX7_FUSHE|nr:hypothetical protein FHETE_3277 [Fusarium heterosporum]